MSASDSPREAVTFDDLPKANSSEASIGTDQNAVGDAAVNAKRHHLSRLVSQDEFPTKKSKKEAGPSPGGIPPLPDPLENPRLLHNHVAALRLEADLYPLRLILSRLMYHPTHNRKGIFNQPVDPVALGLPDYDQIVKNPMDLGTVKRRLHAIAYRSREEAIQDIRLVFVNAITYNPPKNPVHISAMELLSYFESCCQRLDPAVSGITASKDDSTPSEGIAVTSSVIEPSAPTHASPVVVENKTNDPTTTVLPSVFPPLAATHSNEDRAISTRHTALCRDHVSLGLIDMPNLGTMYSKSLLRVPKRPASFTKQGSLHACQQCMGRTCVVCFQGCLQHEPALLVCCGAQCTGSRIRKGGVYFTSRDGSHQVCDRCFVGLPSSVPFYMQSDTCRYKRDLLKRKNEEEIAEEWITCSVCTGGVHVICAMHNGYVHDKSQYRCPDCRSFGEGIELEEVAVEGDVPIDDEVYTFVSGSEAPVPLRSFRDAGEEVLDSNSLQECPISKFIQEKVRIVMNSVANTGKTITARVISDCHRHFTVPEPVRRYFRMEDNSSVDPVVPPKSVQYRQKAIVVFQKIDGLDVCVFCMYVQEYNLDTPDSRMVYIAYIDSVEHFRPRELRTQAFHEILVAYLATARERGYTKAHIWACPPSRGNCFVFWNHPLSQRVPSSERLQAWYHNALSRGIDAGVVVDVESLYESDFEQQLSQLSQDATERMVCPPLIDGDFWIEEAVRVHQAAIDRNLKVRSPAEVCVWNVGNRSTNLSPCPALQVASLLKDRIMTHPSSVPFRRPVNAAALKLKDYHKIVKKPVDLGTIYSRCILGEYCELRDIVRDVFHMVANAKKFNPPGHVVNSMATEVLNLFNSELNALTKAWGVNPSDASWQAHETTSMSLDMVLDFEVPEASPEHLPETPVVVIEDDRSFDGSRSMSSSVVSETSSHVERDAGVASDTKKAESQHRERNAPEKPAKILDLHTDGPEAVMQKMVGKDEWLMKKRNQGRLKPLKDPICKRRRRLSAGTPVEEEPPSKKRRQSWLCEEVGIAIRKMRTSFFACTLSPKEDLSEMEAHKLRVYKKYVAAFDPVADDVGPVRSSLADTRSGLLELSQFRNFEFDTLRRAKYSTNMLLYHILHFNAPGEVPSCTACGETIKDVRWHKAKHMSEYKTNPTLRQRNTLLCPATNTSHCNAREDLCAACYEPRQSEEEFIPIPVSSKSGSLPP